MKITTHLLCGTLIGLGLVSFSSAAELPGATLGFLATPLRVEDLDNAAFTAWADGEETAMEVKEGPRRALWTQTTRPEWDGVRFGQGKTPGPRHLRIGWTKPLPVGAVLVCGTVQLSVLKPDAAYPGNLAADAEWTAAQRVKGDGVSPEEAGRQDYALWVLPPGTATRAIRFTHTARLTDADYGAWLGGAYVLSSRVTNLAPQAVASADARPEAAARINDGSNNGFWDAWDNGQQGAAVAVSPAHPECVMLTWPEPVSLGGLCALAPGFRAAEVQAYVGPARRHPREAEPGDWQPIKTCETLTTAYPVALWPNWIDFGRTVTTRAIRLRITAPTDEPHPHLAGKTKDGKRVWLGELMALRPLADQTLESAVGTPRAKTVEHAPIPLRFHLDRPGFVTLVIEDREGRRVRNVVGETPFPAGDNVAWWDGMDDLGRDVEAARHGVYHIPGKLVSPGTYRVHGLVYPGLQLRYEFSVYNAGSPAWTTADHTGGWLTNHTPPSAALFVPGEKTPNGKPMVYLGSYVSEGGDGLAWVDLSGRKHGGVGWVGGNWTGAPFLARDSGPRAVADHFAYVAAAWESEQHADREKTKPGEIRLTALTAKGDKPVIKYPFTPVTAIDPSAPGQVNWGEQLGGVAVRNGVAVLSLCRLEQLVFIDVAAGRALGTVPLANPGGLCFDPQGRLYVFSGKQLRRYALPDGVWTAQLPTPEIVVADGLQDPQQMTLDAVGNIYLSDCGTSHQVKVFDPSGKPLRTIGKPGVPRAGPYDPQHMNNPAGLAIDANNHLWVAEADFQPKRVSVWSFDGELLSEFYGPAEYGGGGKLDPQDKTRFYYHGMEFHLDWHEGRDRLVRVLYRPGPADLQLPSGFSGGMPEYRLQVTTLSGARHSYFANCFNSNPTNGAPIACLWIERDGLAVPVAAFGRAQDWKLLKGDEFRSRWPASLKPGGDYWRNQAVFVWSDLNGDGQVQPDEVTMLAVQSGGITVMPDLALVASRIGERAMRFSPARFTDRGVPVYDLAAGEVLAEAVQGPASSGGDQALVDPGGWTVLTVAPQPFAPQSLCGVFRGQPRWSYPSPWPGLHASHESPAAEQPGQVIGTTRLLGGFVTPHQGDAGPLWAINGNMGNMYLFTADGLFVAELFHDQRQGILWAMPVAVRGMLLNDLTLHDENFWPSLTQTPDGKVYLVDGARTSLVRIDGLEAIRRLPAQDLAVTAGDLEKARQHFVASESRRQASQGRSTLKIALRSHAPVVDGKLDDWQGTDWAILDRSGVAAYFDSRSRPYDVTAAASVAGDRLFVAFRTGNPQLLENSGELPQAPFKTGGALDLMLGAGPQADPRRQQAVTGDLRLLVTTVKGKTLAVLYRPVVPGTKDPVPFSSPWRTITIDRVEDVSQQVKLAGTDGNFEFSVSLALLGLKPEPGRAIKADLGVLRGDKIQTLQRVYWSNKATGLTSDVPSEAQLTPGLWGRWEFVPE
jgi:hypothetical protein